MAKYVISKDDLPAIDAETLEYQIRFRLISENRNRISSWSPIYSAKPNFSYVTGNIDIIKTSGRISVTWDAVSLEKNNVNVGRLAQYDIWLNWYKNSIGVGDWIYQERVSTTNLITIIPSTFYINGVDQSVAPDRVLVEVYDRGNPITRDFTGLRLYNPPAHSI